MPKEVRPERKRLEENLWKALDEAWSKVNAALDATEKGEAGFEKQIWLAAEAADYSSLLFSLTYGLQDVDPATPEEKGRTPLELVRVSAEALRQIRATVEQPPVASYGKLRDAVQALRSAYLDKTGKRARPK